MRCLEETDGNGGGFKAVETGRDWEEATAARGGGTGTLSGRG